MPNRLLYNSDGSPKVLWAFVSLNFKKKIKPFFHPDQGRDMLKIAIVLEVLRTLVTLYKNRSGYLDTLSGGIVALIFLSMIYGITRYIFPIKFRDIGLRKPLTWNIYEFFFAIIVIPATAFAFWYIKRHALSESLRENSPSEVFLTFICYISFGFYQEWIYRGFIQTELTRRYGPVTAIIVATLAFTFQPLNLYEIYHHKYLVIGLSFIAGLIFGILYYRSYNLWIVGFMHGLALWFLTGLP